MADERTLKFNATSDISNTKLTDIAPDKIVRLYLYELSELKTSSYQSHTVKALFNELTTSYIRINNNTDTFKNLPKEKLGTDRIEHPYIEVLCDELIEFQQILDAGESAWGKKLRSVKSYDALSNQQLFKELEMIPFMQSEFLPIVATLAPIKVSTSGEYVYGWSPVEQQVFFLSSFDKIAPQQFGIRMLDTDGLYSLTLSDYRLVEQQFNFCKIIFLLNQNYIGSAWSQLEDLEYIKITPNRNSLLTTDFAKLYGTATYLFTPGQAISTQPANEFFRNTGVVDLTYRFKENRIDVTNSGNLNVLKALPIDVNGKITMYSEWFDRGRIPKSLTFVNGPKTVRDCFKDISSYALDDDAINDLEDMMLITYLHRTSYRDLTPITDETTLNYGKMSVWYTIGHGAYRISEIQGSSPLDFNNGIVSRRIIKLNHNVDKIKGFTAALNFLSKYIISDYTIEKGASTFYDAWSYYYLAKDLNVGCNRKASDKPPTAETNVAITWALSTQIDSIDVVNGYWEQDIDKNVSKTMVINWDHLLMPPSVPASITTPFTKSTSNGDVTSSAGSEIGMMWYYISSHNMKNFNDMQIKPVFDKQDWSEMMLEMEGQYGSATYSDHSLKLYLPANLWKFDDFEKLTISGMWLEDVKIEFFKKGQTNSPVFKLTLKHWNADAFGVTKHDIILV